MRIQKALLDQKGLSTFSAIIVIASVVVSIVVLVTFMNMDDSLARERFATQATYEGEYLAATESSFGGQASKYCQFKLENGVVVNIPLPLLSERKSEPQKGDRATVYYRKGHFTGRLFYDSFEFPKDSVPEK